MGSSKINLLLGFAFVAIWGILLGAGVNSGWAMATIGVAGTFIARAIVLGGPDRSDET